VTISRALARRSQGADEQRFSIDTWLGEYLIPSSFSYNGTTYPLGLNQTLTGSRIQEISSTLPSYMAAVRRCPPAFAAQMVRALALSQMRFAFRNPPYLTFTPSGKPKTPREVFGTPALGRLERPWPNGTTGEMVGLMEWHEGLTGNAFVVRQPSRLRVLRPDWVGILYGSDLEPDDPAHALDGELLGYVYCNGGFNSGNTPRTLLPDEVAHWSPNRDPETGVGMSWISAAVREMQGDEAAAQHKLAYFRNGATANLVVKGIPAVNKQEFDEIVDMLEARHTGVANAFRTLYLTSGADAHVVGSNLQEIDFRAVVGAGETRVAMLSRVHPVILAAAEGLQGSALNAGNFGMARRIWADTWISPTLQDLAGAMASIIDVPAGSELWFDTTDMPILREDAKDAAEIDQIMGANIRQLVDGGFDPDSVVATIAPRWRQTLRHSGLLSVQLNPPGGPAGLPPEQQAARNLAEIVQKLYLGVGVVLSEAEAREMLNQAGADLPIPGPTLTPAPTAPAGGA
jgi:phage portal protein BeeE